MMISQKLSMIGYKEDNRILIQLIFDQRLQQTPDLMIQMSHAGIVPDLHLPDKLRIQRAGIRIKNPSSFPQRFVIAPVTDRGRRQFFSAVHVKIALRRIKRRMRTKIGGKKKKGHVRIPSAQEINGTIRHPVGGMVFFLINPWSCHP